MLGIEAFLNLAKLWILIPNTGIFIFKNVLQQIERFFLSKQYYHGN